MKSLTILILLSVLVFEAYAQADRRFIRRGNSEYHDGKYQPAEVHYRKALEEDTKSATADFNLGNALYRQQQYDAAATRYSGLAEKETDKQKLNRYFYNLGNTLYEKKQFTESIQAYKNALRNNPHDMDAKHNLQLALSMLNDQQQQQNQNNQQQKNDQQQNKQEGDSGKQDQQTKQDSEPESSSSQPQQVKGQISPQDAERILQALENQEKEVMKEVQQRKEKAQKIQNDKNW